MAQAGPDQSEGTMTSTTAGRRLAKHRKAAGLRLDDASVRVRDRVGPNIGVSRETIRRYEVGKVAPEDMNPITLTVMADVYNVSLSELAPWVDREEVRNLIDLVIRRNSWNQELAGQAA